MENHEETTIGHDGDVVSSMNDSAFVVVDENQDRLGESSTTGSFFLVSPSSSMHEQQTPPLTSSQFIEEDGVLVSIHRDQQILTRSSAALPETTEPDTTTSFHEHQRLEPSLLVEDNLFNNNNHTPPPSPKIRVRSRSDGTVHLISPIQAHYVFPDLMKTLIPLEPQTTVPSLYPSVVSTLEESGDGIELDVDASSFVLEGIIEFAQYMQSGERAFDLETDKPFILERFSTRLQLEQLLVFLQQIGFRHMIEGVEAILAEMSPVTFPLTTQPLLEETKMPDREKSAFPEPSPPTDNEPPTFLRWAVPAATATVLGVGALVLLKAMR